MHGFGLEMDEQTVSSFQVVSCQRTQNAEAVEFWQLQLPDVEQYYHILDDDSILVDACTGVLFAMAAAVSISQPEEIVAAAMLLVEKHPVYSNLSGHADGKLKKFAASYKRRHPEPDIESNADRGIMMPPGSVPIKQEDAAMYDTRQSKNRGVDKGLHNAPYKPKKYMSAEEKSIFDAIMRICAIAL